jgi:hypothetical protein
MENQYNFEVKSKIFEKHADYLFEKMYEQLKDTMSEQEVQAKVAEAIQKYYVNLGRALFTPRKAEPGHLPFIEEYNDSTEEITKDISVLYGETEEIGSYLADYFNYAQSEKLRVQQRIRGLTGLTNDLNLIANDTSDNGQYFRDSFDDSTGIETSMIIGKAVQVATAEGIVTLARSGTVNRSNNAKIKAIQGNGEAGTYHLVRDVKVTQTDGTTKTNSVYVSDQAANDNANMILDGRPDTIFEYQMVNVKATDITDVAKGYDFDWVNGKKQGDKLRLKIVIELEDVEDINWININPYNPALSTGKVVVYSIRTSADGFDYQGLYEGGNYIINSELNTTPQTYRADAIFDGSNSFTDSKFAGQGVWAFPTRKAKYIEVVLDQNESYEEKIGHTYYQKVKKGTDGTDVGQPTRIKSADVPDTIKKSPSGRYNFDKDTDVVKDIESFIGWRYAIGIRDINIMSYQFEEKSELVSKRYEVDGTISEVMIYANEKIPQSYLTQISTSNDWIQYFVSFDDVNWIQMSPMHHQPVTTTFPPKILQINGNKTDLESSFQLYKTYIDSDKPVTGVRLKVVMSRPSSTKDAPNMEYSTPILEDYAIRVILNDEHIQE